MVLCFLTEWCITLSEAIFGHTPSLSTSHPFSTGLLPFSCLRNISRNHERGSAFAIRTPTAGPRSSPPQFVSRGPLCLWACSPSRHARCWTPPAAAAAPSAVVAFNFVPGWGGESSGGGRRPALLLARRQWPHRRGRTPVSHRPDRPGATFQPLGSESR